jgi:hypothetical protein
MNPKSEERGREIEDLLMEAALDINSSKDQIATELKSAGVDIDDILKRAGRTIGSRVRNHLKECSAAASVLRANAFSTAVAEFAGLPIDRIRAWLKEVAEGGHGIANQALAQPCFRNRSAAEMTEEEVRNLAAEIKATMDSGDVC